MPDKIKILGLGVFKSGTGYDKAAIENMMALNTIPNVELVVRSIRMTNGNGEVPYQIKQFEQNNLDNIDIILQYNLPSEFVYTDKALNIGAFAYETDNILPTGWETNLSLMDQILVPCSKQREALSAPLQTKTKIIPYSVDTQKFNESYEEIDFNLPKDTVKFYTISEFNKRKNISALLLAYYSAFTCDDNVVLILKCHVPSRNPQESTKIIKETINDIKNGTRLSNNANRYPKVILLTNFLSDSEIHSLHKTCDIFVSASHGEAWCFPAIDAIGFGNYIIAPNYGAFKDYIINNHLGLLVDGQTSPCFGVMDAPKMIYSSKERWFNVDVGELADNMLRAYRDIDYIKNSNFKQERKEYINNNVSREIVGRALYESFMI
jgi:glycosyltransferase involved in cell wall biosynthesis